jgi:hypothetical protein
MNRIPSAVMVALVSSLALLPIIIVTLLVRAIALAISTIAKVFEPSYVPWRDLMAYDPVYGWKPRPNLDTHYYADRDDVFHLTTDEEGWPGRRSVDEADVIAVGDSFAFGYGIDSAQAFFSLEPLLRIKPVGAPGYSMVHGLRIIEQLGSRLSGKSVLWMIYLENDLQDNLAPNMHHYRAPFLRPAGEGTSWEVASEHISPEPWTTSKTTSRAAMLACFCVPGPIADRAYSACEWLLHRAYAVCRRHDAELVIISVPHRSLLSDQGCSWLAKLSPAPEKFDPSLPDQKIGAVCERLQIRFVAGRELFQYSDYKDREGIHWNARGHRRMAALASQMILHS